MLRKSFWFALLVVAAGLAPAPAGAHAVGAVVTPFTSLVFVGDDVQTLPLGVVTPPRGGAVTLLEARLPARDPRAPLGFALTMSVSVDGMQNVTLLRGEFDPRGFAFGISAIPIELLFGVRSSVGMGFEVEETSARVLRPLPSLPPGHVSIASVIGSGGITFRIPPRRGLPPQPSVTANVAWGDGAVTTAVLPVTNGEVVLPPDLHRYAPGSGSFPVVVSYEIAGELFAVTTTVHVPAPSAMLLLAGLRGLALAGIGAGARAASAPPA